MAEALYRKYRPQIFEDVVGQEHIERTIKNAIGSDKVSHAYLFCGPRGTGKTTTARLLAKALLCQDGPTPEPDGTCESCLSIACGEHPDVYELDAASRTGVENVREEIISRVHFAPTKGRYKVYIIDEVHMLSTAAFNALLKTLEEPPSHVVFILCTTDSHKVPDTIHSRCQRFDFHRISCDAIVSRLGAICVAEDVEFEGDALDLIAHRAEGGMRNALTSLEQLIAFGEGKVTLDLAERLLGSIDRNDLTDIITAIAERDVAACFKWTAQFVETGADLAQFVRDLSDHVRNLYVTTLSGSETILELDESARRELMREKDMFGVDRLARMLGLLGDLSNELRTAINPRLSFEITLTRLARPDSDVTLEALAERIETLERALQAPGAGAMSYQRAEAEQSRVRENIVPLPSTQASAAPSNEEHLSQPRSAKEESVADRAKRSSELRDTEEEQQPLNEASQQPCEPGEAGLENPAVLQRIWKTVLQRVKSEKTAYGVLFLNTKVVFDKQKQDVVIEFPLESVFAYSAVQKPDVRKILLRAFEETLGYMISVRFAQAQPRDPSREGPAAFASQNVDALPTLARKESQPVMPVDKTLPEEPIDNALEVREEVEKEPDEDVGVLLKNIYGDIVFEEINEK